MKYFNYLLIFLLISCQGKVTSDSDKSQLLKEPWQYRDSILNEIQPIIFPDKTFNIVDYGAKSNVDELCTEAINNAIKACSKAGGGKVIVPAGTWLTGPIHLKSNVNLHIKNEGILLFTTDKSKYLPLVHTRFEGMELMNYSPFIYAYKQHNIAVTGKGTIDGQGHVWWHWKGKWSGSVDHGHSKDNSENQANDVDILTQMVADNVPLKERVFGEGHYLRPSFIEPYLCKNVLIKDITILRSPMWIIHPVLSENVTVKGVKIESLGPNNDGCNPECCNNVLIDSCYFNTGDDCIAIKSGRNNDGRRIGVPSTNIIVQNCHMVEGHGGVVMGSEISGNVSHVFAENCTMDSPNLDRAVRIKSNSLRGGVVEHIYVRDIEVKQVKEAVLKVNLFYAHGRGNNIPSVKNILLENVNSYESNYGCWLKGIENSEVTNIHLTNCSFTNVKKGNFIENVKSITFDNVKINGKEIE